MAVPSGVETRGEAGEDAYVDLLYKYQGDHGYRWVAFAGLFLLALAIVNLVEGLSAVGDPEFFVNHPHRFIGDLTVWGSQGHDFAGSLSVQSWIGVLVGAVELVVGFGVAVKDQPSRWIGVAVLGLHACAMLLIMPVDTAVSAALLTVDLAALYALARYGMRTDPTDEVRLTQTLVHSDTVSGSTPRKFSPSSMSHRISSDGRGSAERLSQEWIAWWRSAQDVTRTWKEWLAADHPNDGAAYRRFDAALAAEERAAAEVMREVDRDQTHLM